MVWELISLPLVGELQVVMSQRFCSGGQREILTFARRFVCLESAEKMNRFILNVGTEELWPVSSRCCQWQMKKGIAGRTLKERGLSRGPKDTRSSQPKIIRWHLQATSDWAKQNSTQNTQSRIAALKQIIRFQIQWSKALSITISVVKVYFCVSTQISLSFPRLLTGTTAVPLW